MALAGQEHGSVKHSPCDAVGPTCLSAITPGLLRVFASSREPIPHPLRETRPNPPSAVNRCSRAEALGRRGTNPPPLPVFSASVAPLGLVFHGDAGPTADAVGYRLSVLRTCELCAPQRPGSFAIFASSRETSVQFSMPCRMGLGGGHNRDAVGLNLGSDPG